MPRPQVVTNFVRTAASSPVAIGSKVLAIIGTGSESFTIQEQVTRSAISTDDALVHGAAATAIIKVGLYKGTAEYVLTTDYTLVGGAIHWVGSIKPGNWVKYYVTYTYTKSALAGDYAPFLTDNINDVVNRCGIESQTSGVLDVPSYLTTGARIAFDIGVRQVLIVPVIPDSLATYSATGFSNAYTLIEKTINGVDPYYIVPLAGALIVSDFPTAITAAISHCHKMSSQEFGKERRAYIGKKNYSTGFTVDDFISEAQGLMDSDVTLVGKYDPIRSISFGGSTGSLNITLDGCFEALMIAAFRTTQFVSDPAMNRAINGAFNGYATMWGDIDVDNLVDNGVCVTEMVGGIIRIVDDITTNISDEIEVDIATVEARDTLALLARTAVSNRFKGARGDNSVSAQLKAFMGNFLDQRLGDGLIAVKGKIDASRVPGSLRKWQIIFSYLPVTKVRDITISFSVDLGLAA